MSTTITQELKFEHPIMRMSRKGNPLCKVHWNIFYGKWRVMYRLDRKMSMVTHLSDLVMRDVEFRIDYGRKRMLAESGQKGPHAWAFGHRVIGTPTSLILDQNEFYKVRYSPKTDLYFMMEDIGAPIWYAKFAYFHENGDCYAAI